MPLCILIVDDDKHTCRILQTLLSRDPVLRARGAAVIVAGDGEEGLRALDRAGAVDLVISDLLMPGMDGFTFCRELRRRPGGDAVPLIVSSAVYKDPITIRKLKVEVGAEFFTKPFQVAEMLAAVRRLLGLASASEAAPPPVAAPATGATGSLPEPPLCRLLVDLFEARTTACLHLQRGEVRLRVHLVLGHVVAVESSSREGALGAFLLERGLLSEAQLCDALAAARDQGVRIGRVLVERGWISEAQLLREMEVQMQRRLAAALRWPDGSWRLDAEAPAYEGITFPGGTPVLVFSALRETARPDAVHFPHPQARLCATPRAGRLREPFERVFGEGSLSLLDRRPRPQDVLALRGDGERDALLVRLEALWLCGLCGPEAAGVERGRGAPLLGRLPGSAALGAGAVAAHLGAADPDAAVLHPQHRQLLAEYVAADGQNFYELLGVPRDAGTEAIQEAYRAALQRLSPERFRDVDLGPDYGRIPALRERYQRALQVLSSPVRRAAYDRGLEQGAEGTDEGAADSELLFRQGAALFSAGHLDEALPLLEEAAAQAPQEPEYHALLGWDLFLLRRHEGLEARQAAERALPALQRALALDPGHVAAHAYLGHIHAALGEDEPAAGHFAAVLDQQPGRRDALAGLERILSGSGQWQRLAQHYRTLIRRLGGQGAAGQSLARELAARLAGLRAQPRPQGPG